MKSVLISIQPKWCELIASGKKTVEVRKTRPKLEVPFKCYIYCTQCKPLIFGDDKLFITDKLSVTKKYKNAPEEAGVKQWNGKVIGEFVCDRVYKLHHVIHEVYGLDLNEKDVQENLETCLTVGELYDYGKGKPLYGWHIFDLKIYDKPKELGKFTVECKEYFREECDCEGCMYESDDVFVDCKCNGLKPLTCPPQSWCYVEEI